MHSLLVVRLYKKNNREGTYIILLSLIQHAILQSNQSASTKLKLASLSALHNYMRSTLDVNQGTQSFSCCADPLYLPVTAQQLIINYIRRPCHNVLGVDVATWCKETSLWSAQDKRILLLDN